MRETLKLIKSISLDIFILYKNFLHWNISKVFISLATIALSFLLSLPLLLVILVIYIGFGLNTYFKGLDTSFYDILTFLGDRPFIFLILIILSLVTFVIALFGYSYRKVLFTKLNLSYLDGKKIHYFKNKYFDFKLIRNYFKVITLISLFISIPVLIFFIIFLILFIVFGGLEGVQAMIKLNPLNAFTVIAFISMIICFIAFIYISYRLLFTIIMLVDKKHYDDDKNPMYYIKESFSKTKNIFVFMKFGLIIILLSIFSLPLGVLQDNFSKSLEDIRVYKEYDLLGDTEKGLIDKSENSYYINNLKLNYSGLSPEKLKDFEVTYFYLNYFFVILNFLIVFGLFEMTVVSFYNHEIIKKHSILSNLFS